MPDEEFKGDFLRLIIFMFMNLSFQHDTSVEHNILTSYGMRQNPATPSELPRRMRTLVEQGGSLLPPPEALHSDFSIAHGTNAG